MLLPRVLASVSLLIVATCLLGGCSSDSTKDAQATDNETQEIQLSDLKVLVVGDETIGPLIARQWAARRDATVEIISATEKELADQSYELKNEIDIVIYPIRMLGGFVEANQLEEIPDVIWNDTEQLNRKELLRHPRTTNIRYANKTWGIPLGEPQFSMIYRKDVLEKLGKKPPITWEEFDDLAKALSETTELKDAAGVSLPTKISLPMHDYWRTQMLLTRVAPYVRTRGRISVAFNRDTLAPMINNQAFVRALDELSAICGSDSERMLKNDPQAAYRDITEGRAAIAITWPSGAFDSPDSNSEFVEQIGIARVPGSEMLFDPSTDTWSEREEGDLGQVALIGFAGLTASISRKSSNLLTTHEFLKWLPSKQISNSVLTKSPSCGPFRASHLGNPMQWTGSGISPDASEQYANLIQQINDETVIVVFPRLAGYIRYINELDKAVANSLKASEAEDALNQAAAEFDKITESFGVRSQRSSLKNSKAY